MTGNAASRRPDHNQDAFRDWSASVGDWTAWDEQWSQFSAPVNGLLVAAARISSGMHVLDVAGGSGEPALTLARVVGVEGRVTASDFVPGMLEVARQRAAAAALRNVDFVEADTEDLPFPDGAFDAVTCRFGLYYAGDARRALCEMRRVLKPGHRVSLVTWGPFHLNAYWSAESEVIEEVTGEAAGEPPEEFRFSDARTLACLMEAAGFAGVESRLRRLTLLWPGAAEDLAARDLEGTPLVKSLAPEGQERLRCALSASYRRFARGRCVALPSAVVIASGAR
jgi:ubiquinone/menaquinone biosynthesis C-methylase UbiE